MREGLRNAGRLLLLVAVYLVLFVVGSAAFAPTLSPPPPPPGPGMALGLLAMALIDSALLLAVVRSSRLHGPRLMAFIAALFYFVKTLTSLLEAVYFMPNMTGPMLPGLLAMTVPLSVGVAPIAVVLGGRLHAAPGPAVADRPPQPPRWFWARVALLSAVVYPALFFLAGWYIAFRSPELRAFYGGPLGDDFLSHMAAALRADPFVYPLEVFRAALWVGAAWLLIRTTRGPWWLGTLHAGLWFALVQNDVHLLPNPLMGPELRLFHFIETASSNLVFAGAIGWMLARPEVRAAGR